jgi:hypothetical protein
MLYLVRCFKILVCITISNIFENDIKSDTGLWLDTSLLSPFLHSGFITVYLVIFYYMHNLVENLWKGSLFLGSLWISCHTHMSFLFWGILFVHFLYCTFTFHTWVRFIKNLFHKTSMIINTITIIIYKIIFTLSLTFSVIAIKYSLKVSAIVSWSVIFLPSTFRACVSFFFISSRFFIYNTPCSFKFIMGV